MGADLYRDDHKAILERTKDSFDMAVKLRDQASSDDLKRKYQDDVSRIYAEMYAHPYYFRDSYNDSSLFWKLNLSWWGDTDNYVDENFILHRDGAERLLTTVKERAELLAYNIRDLPDEDEHELDKRWFFGRFERFIDFLQQVIEGNHTVVCSV